MAAPGSLSLAAVEVIRQRMAELGLSGKRLAAEVGMPQTSLARLLRGQGDLTLDELAALAAALGTNLPGLVHDTMSHHRGT
jgi:transcriptional regulator with XRE-family HTH domain